MSNEDESKKSDEGSGSSGTEAAAEKPVGYLFPENSIYDMAPIVVPDNMKLSPSTGDQDTISSENAPVNRESDKDSDSSDEQNTDESMDSGRNPKKTLFSEEWTPAPQPSLDKIFQEGAKKDTTPGSADASGNPSAPSPRERRPVSQTHGKIQARKIRAGSDPKTSQGRLDEARQAADSGQTGAAEEAQSPPTPVAQEPPATNGSNDANQGSPSQSGVTSEPPGQGAPNQSQASEEEIQRQRLEQARAAQELVERIRNQTGEISQELEQPSENLTESAPSDIQQQSESAETTQPPTPEGKNWEEKWSEEPSWERAVWEQTGEINQWKEQDQPQPAPEAEKKEETEDEIQARLQERILEVLALAAEVEFFTLGDDEPPRTKPAAETPSETAPPEPTVEPAPSDQSTSVSVSPPSTEVEEPKEENKSSQRDADEVKYLFPEHSVYEMEPIVIPDSMRLTSSAEHPAIRRSAELPKPGHKQKLSPIKITKSMNKVSAQAATDAHSQSTDNTPVVEPSAPEVTFTASPETHASAEVNAQSQESTEAGTVAEPTESSGAINMEPPTADTTGGESELLQRPRLKTVENLFDFSDEEFEFDEEAIKNQEAESKPAEQEPAAAQSEQSASLDGVEVSIPASAEVQIDGEPTPPVNEEWSAEAIDEDDVEGESAIMVSGVIRSDSTTAQSEAEPTVAAAHEEPRAETVQVDGEPPVTLEVDPLEGISSRTLELERTEVPPSVEPEVPPSVEPEIAQGVRQEEEPAEPPMLEDAATKTLELERTEVPSTLEPESNREQTNETAEPQGFKQWGFSPEKPAEMSNEANPMAIDSVSPFGAAATPPSEQPAREPNNCDDDFDVMSIGVQTADIDQIILEHASVQLTQGGQDSQPPQEIPVPQASQEQMQPLNAEPGIGQPPGMGDPNMPSFEELAGEEGELPTEFRATESFYELAPFVIPERLTEHDSVKDMDFQPPTPPPPPSVAQMVNATAALQDRPNYAYSDPLVGTVLGDSYEILDVIGQGGMAIVYRARQIATDRLVAIKTLKSPNPNDLIRFSQEIKTHSRLDHKNIVHYIDAVNKQGQLFLVMERVRGISLQEIIRTLGKLDSEELIVDIMGQILDALDYAHHTGLIHRDLKTGNIILIKEVDDDMVVKILDFGIAKHQGDLQRLTHAGQALGSPIYMSPEQCAGKILSTRSDLYSLGVVAYEIVTGTPPYSRGTLINIMAAHCNENIRPIALTEAASHLRKTRMLDQILQKSLETNPDKRWQAASDFKRALDYWARAVANDSPEELLPPDILEGEIKAPIYEETPEEMLDDVSNMQSAPSLGVRESQQQFQFPATNQQLPQQTPEPAQKPVSSDWRPMNFGETAPPQSAEEQQEAQPVQPPLHLAQPQPQPQQSPEEPPVNTRRTRDLLASPLDSQRIQLPNLPPQQPQQKPFMEPVPEADVSELTVEERRDLRALKTSGTLQGVFNNPETRTGTDVTSTASDLRRKQATAKPLPIKWILLQLVMVIITVVLTMLGTIYAITHSTELQNLLNNMMGNPNSSTSAPAPVRTPEATTTPEPSTETTTEVPPEGSSHASTSTDPSVTSEPVTEAQPTQGVQAMPDPPEETLSPDQQ